MLWKLWLCECLYKQSQKKEVLSYRIAVCQVPEGKITEPQICEGWKGSLEITLAKAGSLGADEIGRV